MVPYSLGIIQQELVPCAFSDKDYLDKTRELIKIFQDSGIDLKELEDEEIDQVLGEYTGGGIIFGRTGGVIESALRTALENMILVQLPFGIDSNNVTQFLMENNMIVRNIKESYSELTGDWLRVSINTKNNNDLLVKKLKKIIYFSK